LSAGRTPILVSPRSVLRQALGNRGLCSFGHARSGRLLQAKGVPLTGDEIAEAELRAPWDTTGNVIPFPARPKPSAPIQPLGETEQLELFAA
jgi:hypothetical protein